MGWRVVFVSQVLPAILGMSEGLRAAGHEPVGLVCNRKRLAEGRPHDQQFFLSLVRDAPPELDVLVPRDSTRIAPLIRTLEPDLLLCFGFPWLIPAEALEVPRLGSVNMHPSLLPQYRGPMPVAWAMRNGDDRIGISFHRMDARYDTGAVLAQGSFPLDGEETWEELGPKMQGLAATLFPQVLERIAAGDDGEPQDEAGASWAGYFEDGYRTIDWGRPAREIHRQVVAWRFAVIERGAVRGPLAELDGETVRVVATRLTPGEGREVATGDGSIWIVETEPV